MKVLSERQMFVLGKLLGWKYQSKITSVAKSAAYYVRRIVSKLEKMEYRMYEGE